MNKRVGGIKSWGVLTTILMLGTFVAGGCAAQNAFKKGVQMQSVGRYDEAVTYFEDATRRKPDNQKYSAALHESRLQAANHHLAEAKRHVNSRDLAAGMREVELSLRYSQTNDQAVSLRSSIAADTARAEAELSEARKLTDARAWDQALTRMSQAMEIHRTLPGGGGASVSDTAACLGRLYVKQPKEDGCLGLGRGRGDGPQGRNIRPK